MSISVFRTWLSQQRDLRDTVAPDSYMQALELFWRGSYDAAAELAAQSLEEDGSQPHVLPFYRLWLECLAEAQDHASLQALSEHLLARGRVEPELQLSLLALRGLIHLELDEWSAVELCRKATAGRVSNAYCLELEQRADLRISASFHTNKLPLLATSKVAVQDYFHWWALVQWFELEQAADQVQMTLNFVQEQFPAAPAQLLVQLHHSLRTGFHQGAQEASRELIERFPEQTDFAFFAALAAYRARDFQGAWSTLEKLHEELPHDADVQQLLALSCGELALADEHESRWSQAEALLQKARLMILAQGGDISAVEKMTRQLGATTKTSSSVFRPLSSWMVLMTPDDYHAIATAPREHIEELRLPIGAGARTGDVCMLAAPVEGGHKQGHAWNIVAFYEVASDPYFHPTKRWQNILKLVERPAARVAVDIEASAARPVAPASRAARREKLKKPEHVFSLDDSALDIIMGAVKRVTEGVDAVAERRIVSLVKQRTS